ncbi:MULTISPECIES: ATP-NAD kinase family protein [Methanothrix]|jgi:predicted polyphosphate/ATP-dependent NAD kinase|uniref:NAD(+)/NADH kinase n=2 Tax=Methanothrix soehngenii TaxID=2223 RepID=F4BYZ9_METSG|nr:MULTISPECIES: ATP-NAD kinase family protein [Methanothrix]NLJ23020.1 ATP-NAD kinase family protein [Methanothrix soehngenii]NYT10510.1 ATP-NAD kinase family protein [Methanosarcinales archaeon]AEB68946.1 NAD(+)/NADH kinase [Methanothrix soehngenii GP6]HPE51743.1 ATP-NAD kinase family protein [Methanothrix soehngenii]HQN29624.1 ATP-NAD kinase family protein [Methanothrix soehngenii]
MAAGKGRIGFLVNPIAGMGGPVGLKGTDGLAEEAIAMGARPRAMERARACLDLLSKERDAILFFTASGSMGESCLEECGLDYKVVYSALPVTSSRDTIRTCQAFLDEGVDLILFCGGDGTARDVAGIAGSTPILAIPAGVKMHSGVFAASPQAAADLVIRFLNGELNLRDTEIVDVDEELYRAGILQTKLYALAKTPYLPVLVAERKRIYSSDQEDEFKDQIALFASEFMRDGSAYIIGAGTTTSRIADILGLEKTLLGVDVVKDGRLMITDASEQDLLELLDRETRVMIIISPIGAQGFILGRGNQQLSAEVIRRVGIDKLIIISTPHKLAEIPYLLVDTGDEDLDESLAGKRQVVTGYRIAQMKDTLAASRL